ncbi:MAG: DUF4345 family protein [Pseudomonadota bacterium]
MIEFAMPLSTGEWLAFLTALATFLIGLGLMLFPRPFMAWLGLAPRVGTNNGVSEVRGPFGGMWAGLGLAALLLAQPLVYVALGTAFVFCLLGRFYSFIVDRTFNIHCVVATLFEVASAVFPIAYGLQIIP